MKIIGYLIIQDKNLLYKSPELNILLLENIHVDDLDNNYDSIIDFITQNNTFKLRISSSYIWVKVITITLSNSQIVYNIYDDGISIDPLKLDFLANISHEIRTPLNGVVGMITLLDNTKMDSEQKDYLGMLNECSSTLMAIVNDILDYSKLEAGKIVLNNNSMNLYSCIELSSDIIIDKITIKSLDYQYIIDPKIPVYILSDYNRIKQVLVNLLNNAVKFTDKGSIIMHVYMTDEESEQDTIRFDITDTGCGISKDDIHLLFKPFYQLGNQITTKTHQGTGLGLSICKDIITLMNGKIWLEKSNLGIGSTFSLEIPIVTDIKNNTTFKNNKILSNKSIFVLDDKVENRMILSNMLMRFGMRVSVFSSAQEALMFCRNAKFDLGIIDICMPYIDGISFINKIRSSSNNNNIPIIAMSSLGDKKQYNDLYKTHLIKPIKEQKLHDTLINIFSNNNPEELFTINTNNESIKVLIAEDNRINMKVLQSFLHKLNIKHIDYAENGSLALQKLDTCIYDIVFLDIRMPILDGMQVIHHFKDNINMKNTYVVAVTAYIYEKDKYTQVGFNDLLIKPVNFRSLIETINKYKLKLHLK